MHWELARSKLPLGKIRMYSTVAATKDKTERSETDPGKPNKRAPTVQIKIQS